MSKKIKRKFCFSFLKGLVIIVFAAVLVLAVTTGGTRAAGDSFIRSARAFLGLEPTQITAPANSVESILSETDPVNPYLALGGSISLTTLGSAYLQNFDTLGNITGASYMTTIGPQGWDFFEGGSAGNFVYTGGAGASTTGDTYSFGVSGMSDRAFGGLQSGTLIPTIGAQFSNGTGQTISSLLINYTGEQWRLGTRVCEFDRGRSKRLGTCDDG